MMRAISIIHVEDLATDAELARRHLVRAGIQCDVRRVETEAELRGALQQASPDIVLSDFTLPQFDGMGALDLAREMRPDTPFIFVSGTLGEEKAVEALKRGATDYVLKTNLSRLAAAVERAVEEARARRERVATERELAETNSRLESIFAALGDVLWSIDAASGSILYLNDAVADVYGYPAESFLAHPPLRLELVHPDDRTRVEREWSELARALAYKVNTESAARTALSAG